MFNYRLTLKLDAEDSSVQVGLYRVSQGQPVFIQGSKKACSEFLKTLPGGVAYKQYADPLPNRDIQARRIQLIKL